jgi:hypothetical protein
VDRRIREALSTSRKRNLIVEGQHFPDTEAASLRTALCTPSTDSFLAMSGSRFCRKLGFYLPMLAS